VRTRNLEIPTPLHGFAVDAYDREWTGLPDGLNVTGPSSDLLGNIWFYTRHNFLDQLPVVVNLLHVRMFRLIFSANTISSRRASNSGINVAKPSSPTTDSQHKRSCESAHQFDYLVER
jgi:hypothetical protein